MTDKLASPFTEVKTLHPVYSVSNIQHKIRVLDGTTVTYSSWVKLFKLHAIAVSRGWLVHQLDVKNAFLHGTLNETVYMNQPPGFYDTTKPTYVCKLRKSLYGLKQAPRAWFTRFHSFVISQGFWSSRSDNSLFIYQRGKDMAYLLLYVDDIVLTASSNALLTHIITALSTEFAMSDLGPLHHFLGITVTRDSTGLFLSQSQ